MLLLHCQKTNIQKHPGSRLIVRPPPFQCYLSLSVWYGVFYTIPISIICVSQEEKKLYCPFFFMDGVQLPQGCSHFKEAVYFLPYSSQKFLVLSLITSNGQIYTFCKSNFLIEKTLWKVTFWYQWTIQCNTDSCCEHMAGGVNIHLYGCVSLLVPECALYLCVYMYETHSKVVLALSYQGLIFIDP